MLLALAQISLFAATASQRAFEFGRIQSSTDWIGPIVVLAAMAFFIRYMYVRDCVETGRVWSWVFTILRVLAVVGIIAIYLRPQFRTEHFQEQNSRVVLLVDSSLSMSLEEAEAGSVSGAPSRSERVIEAFAGGDWLSKLRTVHDVLVFRFAQETNRVAALTKKAPTPPEQSADAPAEPAIDWATALDPQGIETRLGAALAEVLEDQRGGPVSGVVVMTDGGQNAGRDPRSAIELARQAKIPVFAIGLGSDQTPANVRLADFVAPVRAHPGDKYSVTGYVQAQGLAGQTVKVELASRTAGNEPGAAPDEQLEEAVDVTLGADGEVTPVRFEMMPEAVGRRTLILRIRPPSGDRNPNDNQQEADIEIVDRKLRVLLFASGPTREYQFLRNLLRRDKYTTVDVLLQSGTPGISQDANEILDDFPTTREEMYEYDAIVAFDPQWTALSQPQIDLLEQWVADQSGGLIVIAGPVHMQGWTADRQMNKIRALYPVELDQRVNLGDESRYGSTEPWPLQLTREGLESEFLWLADSASDSAQHWESFPGVYGYYSVRGVKPTATVYARFTDPQATVGGEGPVYMAGQFYGSGRVFYMGSGEMWRLRSIDEAYFEAIYTKLLRNVTQGRLLRGSSRGTILVERDRYLLGQTVIVRAQLTDLQHEPLSAENVVMQVIRPDGTTQSLSLAADPSRPGGFVGQFSARQEGVYRLELPLPDDAETSLSRRIQVKVPDLERENPRRNDPLLSALAKDTGGQYYVGLNQALGFEGGQSLFDQLRDKTRTKVINDKAIPLWNNFWMMGIVCGLLCLEWLLRRLNRLA